VKTSDKLYLDSAVINANVITVDEANPRAESVGCIGDRIVFVGKNKKIKDMIGPKTKVIDAKGKTVLPGFVDSHMHPILTGQYAQSVQLGGAKNIKEFIKRVEERAKKTPKGELILGFGYNEELLEELRCPTRWELDKVTPNNPIFLVHWNTHGFIINTAMMKLKGIDRKTKSPEGGTIVKDERGEPTGVLLENAVDLVAPGFFEEGGGLLNYEQAKSALLYAANRAVTYGVTSMTDILASDFQMKAWFELDREGKLPARVNFFLHYSYLDRVKGIGMVSGFGNNKVRFAGLKMMTDGSLSSHSAALTVPYLDKPDTSGILRVPYEEIKSVMLESVRNGIKMDIHALGDLAVTQVLKAYKEVKKETGVKDPYLRLTHAIVLNKKLIDEITKLNIILDVQPVFLMGGQKWIPRQMSPQMAKWTHPYHTLLERGVHMACGNDSPIENENQFRNVYALVTRQDASGFPEGGWHPDEKVSLDDALRMVTLEGAYATGQDDVKGSIEVGKLADMIIISGDPYGVKESAIKDIKVLKTIVGGNVVYSAK